MPRPAFAAPPCLPETAHILRCPCNKAQHRRPTGRIGTNSWSDGEMECWALFPAIHHSTTPSIRWPENDAGRSFRPIHFQSSPVARIMSDMPGCVCPFSPPLCRAAHTRLPVERALLPVDRDFLPVESCFPAEDRSFLPVDRGFPAEDRSFLPVERGFPAEGRSFLPVERCFPAEDRSLLPVDRGFLPVGRGFLPVGRGFPAVEPGVLPVARSFPGGVGLGYSNPSLRHPRKRRRADLTARPAW